jgi:hypothetical protein
MATDKNTIQSASEQKVPQKRSFFREFFALKSLLVSFSIVGLLTTNIATLVDTTAHDLMHRALWNVLSIGGDVLAAKAMINSPKANTDKKLKIQAADLEAKNKQLDELNARKNELAKKLETNGKAAKATASKVHKRLAAGVLRNIAALPSKAAPVAGVTALVAFTTMDVYDACQTMKDFNELLVRLGEGEENPDLCGKKVPSADEVKKSVKSVFEKKSIVN